jgi:putative transposase
MGDTWQVDELFVTIQGRRHYRWRAVDEDGDVLDILRPPPPAPHASVRRMGYGDVYLLNE